jgi:hypothetical protein
MKKISCFIDDFPEYGIFTGALLQKEGGDLRKVIKSAAFYNKLSTELELFLRDFTYSRENCEKYFGRLDKNQ